MQDDGYHEIQLNGKQLVFLFMATTVVSVVIFLCGVLVGRSVRAQRESVADVTSASVAADGATPQPGPAPASPADQPTKTQAQSTPDRFTYPDLDKPKASVEPLKPATEKAAASAPPAREPSAHEERAARTEKRAPAGPVDSAAPPATPAESATPGASVPRARAQDLAPGAESVTEPSGQGFAVQIAALNARSEADAIAKRLTSKGYSAYVLAPPNGTPAVFRVRVGKFNTRREAETIAAKLQKEEQFKPWVTR